MIPSATVVEVEGNIPGEKVSMALIPTLSHISSLFLRTFIAIRSRRWFVSTLPTHGTLMSLLE
jgi:hypothetical protein